MNTKYHAEVVGSLLRPSNALEARQRLQEGTLSASNFKRVEDRSVDQVIAMQEAAGVDVVTDGEIRRTVFFDQFIQGIEGLGPVPAPALTFHDDKGNEKPFQIPVSVTERIRRRKMMTVEEFTYARARARRPVKVTLPSPFLLYVLWSPEHSPAAYPDPFELFIDGARLMHEEATELAALGCEYIQIDAPDLLQNYCDDTAQRHMEMLGLPVERIINEGVDLLNSIATGISGVTFGLHMCRGNNQDTWMAEGGYEEVAERALPRAVNFDIFLLEYDDARSGSFEPLRELPEDKTAVLGLVSTKQERVESAEEIERRVREASKFIDISRLAVSTQCGFSSATGSNIVNEGSQERKLRLVAEVAERVWG